MWAGLASGITTYNIMHANFHSTLLISCPAVVESILALEPRLTWTTMLISAIQTIKSIKAMRRSTLVLERRLTWTTMPISRIPITSNTSQKVENNIVSVRL